MKLALLKNKSRNNEEKKLKKIYKSTNKSKKESMSRHGWYSMKQHKQSNEYRKKDYDCHIYLNSKNEEVVCTSVSSDREKPKWDDVVYMGEVVSWLRNDNLYLEIGKMRMSGGAIYL